MNGKSARLARGIGCVGEYNEGAAGGLESEFARRERLTRQFWRGVVPSQGKGCAI